MLDQSRVASGFDVEILLGERQLTYFILGLIDAGTIPTTLEFTDSAGQPITVSLFSPAEIDRTYKPAAPVGSLPAGAPSHPYEVEILFEHPTGADVRIHVFGGLLVGDVDLFVGLTLQTTHDADGALAGGTIGASLLDFEGPTLVTVAADHGVDKATLLAKMRERIDRTIDLGGVGSFKRLQDVAFRKVPAEPEHPAALGLYINLRLLDGPPAPRPGPCAPPNPATDSVLAARGDLAAAHNFLPAGSDAAMASRPGLFNDIATDAFARFAEVQPNGDVTHPWHKSISNPGSDVIGKIKGVSVGPKVNANTLRIDVHVEYALDNFFDPDAHLVIELTPVPNSQGVLDWSIDADFHASLLLEVIGVLVLASLFTGVGALVGFSLAAAIASGLIAGELVDALGHFIVDEIYSGRAERKVDAGLPDVVRGRIEVGQRRWDPLYATHHQVAMRPDGALVNDRGVALWGRAVLDREIEVVPHVVIRDKQAQAPSPPTHLRYRVDDAEAFRDDFEALAPGTDRRDFEHDPAGEPTLFQFTIEQIEDRLAERRIIPDLAYVAKRVDVRQHQVHSILAISNREINEQRNALIGAFAAGARGDIEQQQGTQIRLDVAAAFAAAGITPTPEQFEACVQQKIGEILNAEVAAFVDGALDDRLEEALLPLLRFDLPPENFAALQRKGILHLLDLEMITMQGGFRYYRDHPDGAPGDNLLSRPRYRSTAGGPVFP